MKKNITSARQQKTIVNKIMNGVNETLSIFHDKYVIERDDAKGGSIWINIRKADDTVGMLCGCEIERVLKVVGIYKEKYNGISWHMDTTPILKMIHNEVTWFYFPQIVISVLNPE